MEVTGGLSSFFSFFFPSAWLSEANTKEGRWQEFGIHSNKHRLKIRAGHVQNAISS